MCKTKKIFTIFILGLIFLIALYLATFAGHNDFGLSLLKKSFALGNDTESILLEVLRFPRVVKAVIAGACLALSGMMLQAVSKNPLAEPFITGISAGAGLGIVLSVLLFSGFAYSLFGFVGALLASLFVILFCGIGKFSVTKLILTGLSVNMFASSIISFILLTNPDRTYVLTYLLTGNISENTGLSDLTLFVLFLVILAFSALMMPKMNFLRLEDDFLPELKNRRKVYNVVLIVLSSILAGMSVLTVGILSFVGIIAPQISKMLVGVDYRYAFFANVLIGAIFILLSDFVARIIIYPLQIPLGLVIAFVGAPIFVYFLVRKGGLLND